VYSPEVFICDKKSVFSTVTNSHAKFCFTLRFITAYYERKIYEMRRFQLFLKSQMWIYCRESYSLFEQRAFEHFFAFALMKMCACLKEHMTVHCVLCALCMVYPGSAVNGIAKTVTDKPCNECKCSDRNVDFQRTIFLILVVRNDKRSSGIDGKTSDCPSRNCSYYRYLGIPLCQ